jgi:hypothetical protein
MSEHESQIAQNFKCTSLSMQNKLSRIFFDKNDYQLLEIVKDILERGTQSQVLRSLLSKNMHPHGIKEMAAERGLRIAYAVAGLLGSLESGKANDRIIALRSLRDEVFLSSSGFYRNNTARILLQIMKELLRSRENELRKLKLAHDFRMVLAGNPRKVRSELAKYHLLEMPEEWNQFAFDDHVHDANTKGRKSPTHLVMDAWIKGIRYLTVVYYNYVRPEVVEELIEASAILDLKVQIGIEMSARFRDKYIRFTWEPHGFRDNSALLDFLQEDAVKQLMVEGREVSRYQQKYVFEVLEAFNNRHRHNLNAGLGLLVKACEKDDFLSFVGDGQPSLFHLARFIHNRFLEQIKLKLPAIQKELNSSDIDNERKEELQGLLSKFRNTHIETIIDKYLLPSRNPEIHDPTYPEKSPTLPARLKLSPKKLLKKLQSLHSSSKFSLNLSNLTLQDTLELLYAGKGMFTHIEAYNLKNAAHGITSGILPGYGESNGETGNQQSSSRFYMLIGDLQRALNDDNVIVLKRAVRAVILDFEERLLKLSEERERLTSEQANKESLSLELDLMQKRKLELLDILYNLDKFHTYYKKKTLHTRIGSGSTGQAEQNYGMGLVVVDTLSARTRNNVRKAENDQSRMRIPVSASLTRNTHDRRDPEDGRKFRLSKALPFLQHNSRHQWSDWSLDGYLVHGDRPGNITTLGGIGKIGENDFGADVPTEQETLKNPWRYLNTNLKNSLKVILGFIPAFLTFYLTKDWWLLAYFGAFIWFGITGSRNIIQSVLGGGGLRRSPLLPWNSLVSWSRIADSLLYTGFSVPLLDYLVKTLLLDRAFGITTATNPIMLYAVMGLANGIYISSHNTIRGLPKSATIGNFFRSIIAIPIAILINALIGTLLSSLGVPNVSSIQQKWAAIISKFASDCVAAIIEGLADRQTNIQARLAAYRMKISQLFSVFSRLDLEFPEEDVLEMLQFPKMMMETLNYEARDQEKLIIVNALDLMYFWMYQPRARKALLLIYQDMSEEEWLIFYRSQLILKRHKEISQVFVDGLVGKNFAKALSFYLDRSEEYLFEMEAIGKTAE